MPRRFRGFAVIERPDGPVIWGTFRPTEAAARAVFDQWNPAVDGHPSQAVVVPVSITIGQTPRRKPVEGL